MRRRSFVFVACSPHPRTGVSTTARLLTDFHLSRHAPVEGFDTDPHASRYAELFPAHVRAVDAADIKGQISLFDRLLVNDETPKIVDVWSRSYDRFFGTVREIGFVEEARRNGVEPVILFHVDPSQTSLARAHALHAAWSDVAMVVVNNEGASPLGAAAHEILAHYPASRKFVIAPLDAAVARSLESPELSLSGFLVAPPPAMSIVVRAALKAWLAPIFTQFRSFELRQQLNGAEFLR
ncbi:hypothetical protein [Methylosinus sp. Sm6]|uniref:hypothetical protein n=1 Tax=Methylosinus sp. Sm6 TaxID=2866948 RepID=UPI001C99B771|nr:hypothetical protein [Methylosinus sp. Sm6]MBY6240281.1 hypothetical protein [Methylosinus sp. Sm6]